MEDRTLAAAGTGGAETASTGETHLSDKLSSTEELAAAVDHLLPLLDLTHTHTHTRSEAAGAGQWGGAGGGTLV